MFLLTVSENARRAVSSSVGRRCGRARRAAARRNLGGARLASADLYERFAAELAPRSSLSCGCVLNVCMFGARRSNGRRAVPGRPVDDSTRRENFEGILPQLVVFASALKRVQILFLRVLSIFRLFGCVRFVVALCSAYARSRSTRRLVSWRRSTVQLFADLFLLLLELNAVIFVQH